MPSHRTNSTPYFSDPDNDSLADFLFEFEGLALDHNLTGPQKVEAILRYIPPSTRNFWMTLNGYSTSDWGTFRASLEALYPDLNLISSYTRQRLQDFVDISARTQLKDYSDFMTYYRRFLHYSNHLVNTNQILDDDRSREFFYGFHPTDRDGLLQRLQALRPTQPSRTPYDFTNIHDMAQDYYSNDQFYRPPQRRVDPDDGLDQTERLVRRQDQ
jgi:hypothetical protein